MDDIDDKLPEILPVLPVRDSVIFPGMVIPIIIRDKRSLKLVDETLKKEKKIVVVMEKAHDKKEKGPADIHKIGTVGHVVGLSKGEEGTILVVQGIARVLILEVVSNEPYKKARIKKLEDIDFSGKKINALMTNMLGLFKQIVDLSPHLPDELIHISMNIDKPGALTDMIVATLNLERNKKQEMLACLNIRERLEKLTVFMNEELEVLKMGRNIQERVKKGMDKSQREYYLREQIKIIQKELSKDKKGGSELDELTEKLKVKDLPEAVRKVIAKESERLLSINNASPEHNVIRTYLDWIIDLPWNESTTDIIDINKAEKVLNKHHYDLEKIKKRILEYLAVRKLNPEHKGPILCLVGPPGTGKTSLGRAIAIAMQRKFIRISLGGVRDEAEIRGHRRTYVGALPGRIIQGIKKAGSNNPVFMLDEIDKVGADFRGDPSSALLEVLDPEQNFSFSDHYLELEFDLSNIIFIATANQLDTVPPALRDRMEVLELTGYTEDEKTSIAKKFLIPRQITEHGLKKTRVLFRMSAIRKIIREYTREAGLRNLEREIGTICRGIARKVAEGEDKKYIITDKEIRKYSGNPRFTADIEERTSVPGVATGMAWTPSGGDILFVEATIMPGQQSLILTGQLGDVMKESARTALSYLRSRSKTLNIPEDFYKDHDIHIHVPAGAIPKDGPSAGVTLLVALVSLLTDRPVKPRLAMTGEVTLRGSVLPVGGIKDKILAANRRGIRHIILPKGNKNDLDEIPEKIKKHLTFSLVSRMDEVLDLTII
ncbi:MAG: endopeptidase La [Desulfobacteraceae bacterium 4484_190.1]|nr:MAG: endopeptidase La [Desulfobacteraceae bacterium 4484_190.1]